MADNADDEELSDNEAPSGNEELSACLDRLRAEQARSKEWKARFGMAVALFICLCTVTIFLWYDLGNRMERLERSLGRQIHGIYDEVSRTLVHRSLEWVHFNGYLRAG